MGPYPWPNHPSHFGTCSVDRKINIFVLDGRVLAAPRGGGRARALVNRVNLVQLCTATGNSAYYLHAKKNTSKGCPYTPPYET